MKKTKKKVKVRDMKPKKDAKGGRFLQNQQLQGSALGGAQQGSAISGAQQSSALAGAGKSLD
jgi:hypothetical protein